MRTVSQAYMDAMGLPVREMDAYVELQWWDGQQLQLAAFNRNGQGSSAIIGAIKTFKVRTSTGGKIAGAVVSQQLILEVMQVSSANEIKVENGRFLTVQIGPIYNNVDQRIFYNMFLVTKVNKDINTGVYTIEAWDFMEYLNVPAAGFFPSDVLARLSYKQIIETIAAQIIDPSSGSSVTATIIDGSNITRTISGTALNNVIASVSNCTIRQFLQIFTEVTGTIAYMTMDSTGHVKMIVQHPYSNYDRSNIIDDIEISERGMAIPITKYFNCVTGKAYPVCGVSFNNGEVVKYNTVGNIGELGYVIKYGNNAYWRYMHDRGQVSRVNDEIQAIADSFYNSTQSASFNVCDYSIDWRADPKLEINDLMVIQNKDASITIVPYCEISLDYDGGLRESIDFKLKQD